MQKTLQICDRCNNADLTSFGGHIGGKEYDLCESCFFDFRKFMKQRGLDRFDAAQYPPEDFGELKLKKNYLTD